MLRTRLMLMSAAVLLAISCGTDGALDIDIEELDLPLNVPQGLYVT